MVLTFLSILVESEKNSWSHLSAFGSQDSVDGMDLLDEIFKVPLKQKNKNFVLWLRKDSIACCCHCY